MVQFWGSTLGMNAVRRPSMWVVCLFICRHPPNYRGTIFVFRGYWVAAKGLKLNYYNEQRLLFIKHPHYGRLSLSSSTATQFRIGVYCSGQVMLSDKTRQHGLLSAIR